MVIFCLQKEKETKGLFERLEWELTNLPRGSIKQFFNNQEAWECFKQVPRGTVRKQKNQD